MLMTIAIPWLAFQQIVSSTTWTEWWTYDGISGPEYWGIVNPEWALCSRGKKQSPIHIELDQLLFDPKLTQPITIDDSQVKATLMNTGHYLSAKVQVPDITINASGGPLSYQYRITEVIFHVGKEDSKGSEHEIQNKTFPAEIQIIGYNYELYGNMSHAQMSTNGVLIIALLAQINPTGNSEVGKIVEQVDNLIYKGDVRDISNFSISNLLPLDSNYITYEGSMSFPPCEESVTWVIMNRPIHLSQHQLRELRKLKQGSKENPKSSLAGNSRSGQPLNRRCVRTNINFNNPTRSCTMEQNLFSYQINKKGDSRDRRSKR